MEFINNIEENEYKNFCDKHAKGHFLESYEWGQFSAKAKNQVAHYVGMKDDEGNLVATALIMEKKTPLGFSYGYSPRGFVTDYTNKEYIAKFTEYLKKYMSDNKYIYIKFDPDIKYQDIDSDAKPIENGENNYELYEYMKSLGYIHKGFNKLYEGNQPRYTFRIDLKKDFSEIEAMFNKSFMKSVKRSYNYNLIIDNEIRIDDFYRLVQSNSSKDDFDPHSKNYYEIFVSELKDKMKFFNVSVRPKEVLENINNSIEELKKELETNVKRKADIENQITKLEKDKDVFSKIDKEQLVICSLICTYTDKKAWSLFIGSDDIANLTFAVSRSYYEAIKDAHDKGYEFFDLFGTVGDPNTNYKNLAKLHDYKRKFGDEYIEFIGEFDLVNKKVLYKVLPVLLKIYRKIRR